MRRYILTGTPGAGKTTVLRRLAALGLAVVEEAATDVIALEQARGVDAPHEDPRFIDRIVDLQRGRQLLAPDAEVQVFDRSPICTWALAAFLGYGVSEALAREVERTQRDGVYERRVFFLDNLGRVEPTAARRISFEDAVRFEAVHERAYLGFGFELVRILAAEPDARAQLILDLIQQSGEAN